MRVRTAEPEENKYNKRTTTAYNGNDKDNDNDEDVSTVGHRFGVTFLVADEWCPWVLLSTKSDEHSKAHNHHRASPPLLEDEARGVH